MWEEWTPNRTESSAPMGRDHFGAVYDAGHMYIYGMCNILALHAKLFEAVSVQHCQFCPTNLIILRWYSTAVATPAAAAAAAALFKGTISSFFCKSDATVKGLRCCTYGCQCVSWLQLLNARLVKPACKPMAYRRNCCDASCCHHLASSTRNADVKDHICMLLHDSADSC